MPKLFGFLIILAIGYFVAKVVAAAVQKLLEKTAIDQKLRELQAMKATLSHLVHCCAGDDRPDCPIIDSLADTPQAAGQ